MADKEYFRAPWDRILQLITVATVAFFIALIVYNPTWVTLVVCGAIITGCAIFMVRGYSIENNQLNIHRLGWTTTVSLAGLQKVEINREAMKGSWRLLGIGGLFGYIGTFRNDLLGNYRAYATNKHNCVIIEFENRTILVTPGAPEDFVEAIQKISESR